MKIFVTGATGFIGNKLANKLAEGGDTIHALCRSPEIVSSLNHPNIKVFKGNVLDPDSIHKAMADCTHVYHLAAFASVWAPEQEEFFRINHEGLVNILDAAKKHQVHKVVFTSTAGTMGPSSPENPAHENHIRLVDFFNEYESSKFMAEEKVQHYVRNGLEVVIVHPSRVYGPGNFSESNAVTKIINFFLKGKWRFIPGDGTKVGNYVFIDDVVKGHILAMDKGVAGERYLLGGENASYNQLFQTIKRNTKPKQKLIKIPLNLMLVFSVLLKKRADWFNIPPLITPKWTRKYLYDWPISSSKAEKHLNYSITPLNEGIRKTVDWLLRNE